MFSTKVFDSDYSTITLGPWEVVIQLVPKEEILGCYGDWDEVTKTIRIRSDLHPTEIAMTFVHEMVHAISDLNHLRLSEQSVRALENTITVLVRSHPVLAVNVLTALIDTDPDCSAKDHDKSTDSEPSGGDGSYSGPSRSSGACVDPKTFWPGTDYWYAGDGKPEGPLEPATITPIQFPAGESDASNGSAPTSIPRR